MMKNELLHINDIQNYFILFQKMHILDSLSKLKLIGHIRSDWTIYSTEAFIERSYIVADSYIYNYILDDIITVKYNFIEIDSEMNFLDGDKVIQNINFTQIFQEDYYYNLYKLYLSSLAHIDIIFLNTYNESLYTNELDKLGKDLNLPNVKINLLTPFAKDYFDSLRYDYNINYNYQITEEIITKVFTRSPLIKFKHSSECLNLIKYLTI